jgi:hypothetical protein
MNHKQIKQFVVLTFCLLSVCHAGAQQVTVSNNLLYDATLTPNLRVGVKLSKHWSAGITGGYRPWPTDDNTSKKWRHLLVSPDARYWTDSVNVHHFFGINAIYSHFNAAELKFPFGLYSEVRDQRLEGDLGAVGGYYGYSWPLGRHWNIEAHIGAAVGYANYNRYKCGHCGTKLGKKEKLFVMPQAGVSIVYNIPGRPRPTIPVEPVVPIVPVDTVVVDTVVPEQPIIIPTKPVEPTQAVAQEKPRKRVERKDEMMTIHFPVSRYVVLEDFADNRQQLSDIINSAREALTDTDCQLKKIQIVGLASVEGGLWGNQRLAQRRANALKKYIQQRVSVPDSLIEVAGGGEAWDELRQHVTDLKADYEKKAGEGESQWMRNFNQKQAKAMQQALDIIDNERDAVRREQRLRSLNGGTTWKTIRRLFPDHRNAGYVRICFEQQ